MKAPAGVFGDSGAADEADPDITEDEDMPSDSSLPADFESAFDEYQANPSAQTFWDAVEACTAAKGSGADIGLLIGPPSKKKN